VFIREAVKTDIGRKRRENQDAFGFFHDLHLYVVADGMGGRSAALVSSLTIEAIHRSLLSTQDEDLTPLVDPGGNRSVAGRRLTIAFNHANELIRHRISSDPRMRGVGTTAAAVLFDRTREQVAICHVGDTRVYRVHGDRVDELTEDHTVVRWLVNTGRIRPDEVKTSPHRHVLTRAVGIEDLLSPDLRLEKLSPGDVYVIASDGLHDVVGTGEIRDVVHDSWPDLEVACTRLIDLANQRGGEDNTTVLIIACDDQPRPEPDPVPKADVP